MNEPTAQTNGRRLKTHALAEYVFAPQKARTGLFVRKIGIARARTTIGMANLAYNLPASSGTRANCASMTAKRRNDAAARTNFRVYQVIDELVRLARVRGKPGSISVDNGPEFAARLRDQRV